MRKSAINLFSLGVAVLFALSLCQAANARPAQDQDQNQNGSAKSFSGVVMDSACAQMGSHSQMESKEGMKSSDRLTGEEARKCTDACVKNGSTYVLYNPSNKMTYQLSDQDKARMYAGDWVKVKGSYDASSKTITVDTITKSHGTMHPSSPSSR